MQKVPLPVSASLSPLAPPLSAHNTTGSDECFFGQKQDVYDSFSLREENMDSTYFSECRNLQYPTELFLAASRSPKMAEENSQFDSRDGKERTLHSNYGGSTLEPRGRTQGKPRSFSILKREVRTRGIDRGGIKIFILGWECPVVRTVRWSGPL